MLRTFLVFSLLIASSAFAETPNRVRKSSLAQPYQATQPTNRVQGSGGYRYKGTSLTIAPSLPILKSNGENKIGYGATVSEMYEVAPGFLIGLESGLFYWTERQTDFDTTTRQESFIIPILGSLMYKIYASSVVHPYFGVSAGAAIAVKRLSVGEAQTRETTVMFNGFLRPGIEFSLTSDFAFSLEPKVGILKDELLFVPQLGLSLRI